MATIKSFTNLSQSKALSKILPLETADMRYGYTAPYDYSDRMYDGGYDEIPYPKDFLIKNPNYSADEYDAELPCWSLASLLEILPIIEKDKDIFNPFIAKTPDNGYYIVYATLTKEGNSSAIYDNPVDACYEMILKLHELNLLQL